MSPDRDHPSVSDPSSRPIASAVNRQDVLDFVLYTLTRTRTRLVVLSGGRLEGKTPLLRWLAATLTDPFVGVYINPVRWPPLLANEIVPFMVKALGQALRLETTEADDFSDAFRAAVDVVLSGRRLVIVVDELPAESLSHSVVPGTIPVFTQLQAAINQWPALSVVVALGRKLHEIDADVLKGLESASIRYLSPLSRDDIRLMAESAGWHLSDDAAARLETLSAGQSYVVSWLCTALSEYARQRGKDVIQVADLDIVLDRVITAEDSGLIGMWHALDVPERLLLIVLTHSGRTFGPESVHAALATRGVRLAGMDLTQALGRLVDLGLLKRRPGSDDYAFLSEAVRRWIAARFPLQGIREAAEKISPRAAEEYAAARGLHDRGELPDAIAGYRRALAINPNHCAAWLGLGQATSERGEIADAVEAYERAYELDPGLGRDGLTAALLTYGRALQNEGNDDAAMRMYRRLLTVAPDDPLGKQNLFVILTRRAEAYLSRSDLARARGAFRLALELEPGNPAIAARLAEVSARRESAKVVLAEPPASWSTREWKTLAGLAGAVVVVGVLLFTLSRGALFSPQAAPPPGETAQASSFDVGTASPVAPRATVVAAATTTITPSATTASLVEGTTPMTGTDTTAFTLVASALLTPTETVAPSPTQTTAPSPTLRPTRTPTRRPPTDTPTATGTPTATERPIPSPTATMTFDMPQLLGPEQGAYFSGPETRIELRWTAVGVLASDEWYGLSVRYKHGGVNTESGAWLKDTRWTVPLYFAGQADEPERKYTWDVVVVRELEPNADGSRRGVEISRRSETRTFAWR